MSGARDLLSKANAIKRALSLTSEAMDLLDAHQSSPEAAVHLDLCRQKLQEDFARINASEINLR